MALRPQWCVTKMTPISEEEKAFMVEHCTDDLLVVILEVESMLFTNRAWRRKLYKQARNNWNLSKILDTLQETEPVHRRCGLLQYALGPLEYSYSD